MKKLILLTALITTSPAAFAGNSLNLSCGFSNEGAYITSNVQLKSGMFQSAQCPKFICSSVWNVTMNYNGNGYEDVTLIVENTTTGEENSVLFHNVKVGSSLEFATQNKKTGKYLTVDCEVTKAQ